MSKILRTTLLTVLLVIFIAATFSVAFAAQKNKEISEANIVFTVEELLYTIQLLERTKLTGSEVDSFLMVYDLFAQSVANREKEKKKLKDKLKITMPVHTAKLFIAIAQRAELTGAEAGTFKTIVAKVVNAFAKKGN
jgi:hypothetical protein